MQYRYGAIPPVLCPSAVASLSLRLFEMSMSPESENFEQLRRLLILKRHEQPPPGYFHHFSREVIVRIKAGDTGETVTAAWWSWQGSWLQRAWTAIESRPALAGAFGVVV